MTILKYTLLKLEKALVFQVNWLDEKYKGSRSWHVDRMDIMDINFTVDTKMYILDGQTTIGLREGITCDISGFATNDKRDETYKNVKQTLKAWAESEKKQETEPTPDIGGHFEV